MRIFLNKAFQRFVERERITVAALIKAVADAESGLIDADLGGGVIKQRIARAGEGKSGGYRTLILYKSGERAFFMYGFAKSDRGNITKAELGGLRELSSVLLQCTEQEIEKLLETGSMKEIKENE